MGESSSEQFQKMREQFEAEEREREAAAAEGDMTEDFVGDRLSALGATARVEYDSAEQLASKLGARTPQQTEQIRQSGEKAAERAQKEQTGVASDNKDEDQP
jgi:hypothetical protein